MGDEVDWNQRKSQSQNTLRVKKNSKPVIFINSLVFFSWKMAIKVARFINIQIISWLSFD